MVASRQSQTEGSSCALSWGLGQDPSVYESITMDMRDRDARWVAKRRWTIRPIMDSLRRVDNNSLYSIAIIGSFFGHINPNVASALGGLRHTGLLGGIDRAEDRGIGNFVP
jgi:hypothetical protein